MNTEFAASASIKSGDFPLSMAALLVRLGRLDQALEVSGTVTRRARRAEDLWSGVKALAQAGRIGEASRISSRISDPSVRSKALVDVAAALARANQGERADRLFDEAWQTAGTVDDSDKGLQRSRAQAIVVGVMTETGCLV